MGVQEQKFSQACGHLDDFVAGLRARLKLEGKRTSPVPGRAAQRLIKTGPCANRQKPECDNLLVVDAREHNPESPGANPHPALRWLLSHLWDGECFWLKVCRSRFRGGLR